MSYQSELMQAINKVRQNKVSISWLGLYGIATVNYVYDKEPEKVLYTLKYENEEITAFDSTGKQVWPVTVSQKLPHSANEKAGRPAKQPGKK